MADVLTLEQRIDRLEAIEAIRQLKAEYFKTCDNKQPEAVRACFVDGPVVIEYGRIGSFTSADAMVAEFERLACGEHIVEMHHAQNPQIEIHSPESASASWGLYYYMIDTQQQALIQLGGYYDDQYRCVDGRWLISATRYRVTSSQIIDASDALARVVFAGREAPTELDDPGLQAE